MRAATSFAAAAALLLTTTFAPLAVAQTAAPATAASTLEQALAKNQEKSWALEEMRLFTAFMLQEGHGLESQAGPVRGRGRQDAWVLQPWAQFRVRQNKDVTHELTVPVDIVSAASTDAIDAVSKASEYNEAATLDLTTTYEASDVTLMSFRFGAHYEEPMRSLLAGPSLTFRLFEENTVIGVSALVFADGFDPHSYTGVDRGFASRTTFSFNLSLTQVLSPTTLLEASAGTTQQWGVLETTWNSVVALRLPTEDDPTTVYRTGEIFPKSRNRDAFSVKISQHVPATHTTAKGAYRFYLDENGTFAHTSELQMYQYIVPWLYLRVHGRWHTQTAPDFWMPYIEEPFNELKDKRTSDSDLEELTAREAGVKIVLLRERAPALFRANDTFDISYLRYQRDNDLHIDFFSLGYARTF